MKKLDFEKFKINTSAFPILIGGGAGREEKTRNFQDILRIRKWKGQTIFQMLTHFRSPTVLPPFFFFPSCLFWFCLFLVVGVFFSPEKFILGWMQRIFQLLYMYHLKTSSPHQFLQLLRNFQGASLSLLLFLRAQGYFSYHPWNKFPSFARPPGAAQNPSTATDSNHWGGFHGCCRHNMPVSVSVPQTSKIQHRLWDESSWNCL